MKHRFDEDLDIPIVEAGDAGRRIPRSKLRREGLAAYQAVHLGGCLLWDLHRFPWMARRGEDDHVIRLMERLGRLRLVKMSALIRQAFDALEHLLQLVRCLAQSMPGDRFPNEGQLLLRPPLVWSGGGAAARAVADNQVRLALGPVSRRPLMPLELLEAIRAFTPQKAVIVNRELH